ncbi:hypothetical protein [Actinoplanes sp. L3-i22]|uniref:hypothetical protein n=1 Tax=Actinoplanes sp. L3-i22 TaxID=2836373 RepID=UPI001C8617DC|nr:hypothetical protein [Actinoplanes sp. L3-i22]
MDIADLDIAAFTSAWYVRHPDGSLSAIAVPSAGTRDRKATLPKKVVAEGPE